MRPMRTAILLLGFDQHQGDVVVLRRAVDKTVDALEHFRDHLRSGPGCEFLQHRNKSLIPVLNFAGILRLHDSV